jgi:hypothetical protein
MHSTLGGEGDGDERATRGLEGRLRGGRLDLRVGVSGSAGRDAFGRRWWRGLREGGGRSGGPDRELLMDAHVPEGDGPFPAVIIAHGGGTRRA